MIRSTAQREQSARTMLQNAFAQGKTDDEAIAFAIASLGADSEGLVKRVWEQFFKIYGPC